MPGCIFHALGAKSAHSYAQSYHLFPPACQRTKVHTCSQWQYWSRGCTSDRLVISHGSKTPANRTHCDGFITEAAEVCCKHHSTNRYAQLCLPPTLPAGRLGSSMLQLRINAPVNGTAAACWRRTCPGSQDQEAFYHVALPADLPQSL